MPNKYEAIGEITLVTLGGINKATRQKNPTELEGYYLGYEPRPNRFNSTKPQNLYKFQTAQGEVGVYGKAGLDKLMKNASVGRMTKVVATGETLDVGKGNPMKVFKVFQDKTNTIEVDNGVAASDTSNLSSNYDADLDDQDSFEESTPSRPVPPTVAASVPNAEKQARLQALLNRNKSA